MNRNIWILVLHITSLFLSSAAEWSYEGPFRDCEYFFTDVSEAVRSTKLLENVLVFPRKLLRFKGELFSVSESSSDDPIPDKSCTADGTPNELGVPGVFDVWNGMGLMIFEKVGLQGKGVFVQPV